MAVTYWNVNQQTIPVVISSCTDRIPYTCKECQFTHWNFLYNFLGTDNQIVVAVAAANDNDSYGNTDDDDINAAAADGDTGDDDGDHHDDVDDNSLNLKVYPPHLTPTFLMNLCLIALSLKDDPAHAVSSPTLPCSARLDIACCVGLVWAGGGGCTKPGL